MRLEAAVAGSEIPAAPTLEAAAAATGPTLPVLSRLENEDGRGLQPFGGTAALSALDSASKHVPSQMCHRAGLGTGPNGEALPHSKGVVACSALGMEVFELSSAPAGSQPAMAASDVGGLQSCRGMAAGDSLTADLAVAGRPALPSLTDASREEASGAHGAAYPADGLESNERVEFEAQCNGQAVLHACEAAAGRENNDLLLKSFHLVRQCHVIYKQVIPLPQVQGTATHDAGFCSAAKVSCFISRDIKCCLRPGTKLTC